jgi:hypothetical protein
MDDQAMYAKLATVCKPSRQRQVAGPRIDDISVRLFVYIVVVRGIHRYTCTYCMAHATMRRYTYVQYIYLHRYSNSNSSRHNPGQSKG